MRIPRGLTLGVVLAICVSACGDGSVVTESTSGEPASESSAPSQETQMAPDFSLKLGNGDTFMLSQEVLPVYMVFWAEW